MDLGLLQESKVKMCICPESANQITLFSGVNEGRHIISKLHDLIVAHIHRQMSQSPYLVEVIKLKVFQLIVGNVNEMKCR